jgi:hypothetical protein
VVHVAILEGRLGMDRSGAGTAVFELGVTFSAPINLTNASYVAGNTGFV